MLKNKQLIKIQNICLKITERFQYYGNFKSSKGKQSFTIAKLNAFKWKTLTSPTINLNVVFVSNYSLQTD